MNALIKFIQQSLEKGGHTQVKTSPLASRVLKEMRKQHTQREKA